MEQKTYKVPNKSPGYYETFKKPVKVTRDSLDQYFGRKKRVLVITTDKPVDEIVIRVQTGGFVYEDR